MKSSLKYNRGACGDADMMRRAISLSERSAATGGGPFGAVIVRDGRVIATGQNRVTVCCDPTAHAEVSAIREASRALGTFNLSGCDIYSSCEPCPMCLAAIYWARIDRIFYANTRADAAAIGFDDDFLYREIARDVADRSKPAVCMPSDEALEVFREWERSSDKTPY